jgi:hypothetical protein
MNRIVNYVLIAVIAATFCILAVANANAQLLSASALKGPNQSSLISTTLVISQVYGGGGGSTGTYLNDYVELKNISNASQSLNGLSLMYGSATGQFGSSATNIFALPNVTLNPGQFYLVQLSNPGTAGAPLPVAPDVSTTNLSMSGTSGKVALVTSAFTSNSCGATATPCTLPNPNIVDLVSWGTANNAEGGASTNGGAAITSIQGNVRKGNGCVETDNNNSDFEIITHPLPRNSTSPAIPCPFVARPTSLDFNGDGKTDFGLTRDTAGERTWYILFNGSASFVGIRWGLDIDLDTPADYDGDGKTDVAVWRAGAPTQARFYILQSMTNTLRIDTFGQNGDRPGVVRDYDGDGKADVAVYRPGASAGAQSFFFYRGSLNNPLGNITYVPWGVGSDVQTNGDFDGDGKGDFAVRRDVGGNGLFYILRSSGGVDYVYFGLSTDAIVPGDYDGDNKSDLAVGRVVGATGNFYFRASSNLAIVGPIVGADPNTDFLAAGDYDGDGRTDVAVWRETDGNFYIRSTATSAWSYQRWGMFGDTAIGEWNVSGGD